MKYFSWDPEKNELLRIIRGITFEEIVFHAEHGNLLAVVEHPNSEKYPKQQIMVVDVEGYAYLVPFVEDQTGVFLKTIIPNRKATRDYIGSSDD